MKYVILTLIFIWNSNILSENFEINKQIIEADKILGKSIISLLIRDITISQKYKKENIEHLSLNVKKDFIHWINIIINQNHLLDNFDNKVYGVKDMIIKKKSKEHSRRYEYNNIYDWVISKYKIKNTKIFIEENGRVFGILIEESKIPIINKNQDLTNNKLKEILTKYLNVSIEELNTLTTSNIKNKQNIYHGTISKPSEAKPPVDFPNDPNILKFPDYWWHKIKFVLTKDFMYIVVTKRNGQPRKLLRPTSLTIDRF